jgi:hypothetical protein
MPASCRACTDVKLGMVGVFTVEHVYSAVIRLLAVVVAGKVAVTDAPLVCLNALCTRPTVSGVAGLSQTEAATHDTDVNVEVRVRVAPAYIPGSNEKSSAAGLVEVEAMSTTSFMRKSGVDVVEPTLPSM